MSTDDERECDAVMNSATAGVDGFVPSTPACVDKRRTTDDTAHQPCGGKIVEKLPAEKAARRQRPTRLDESRVEAREPEEASSSPPSLGWLGSHPLGVKRTPRHARRAFRSVKHPPHPGTFTMQGEGPGGAQCTPRRTVDGSRSPHGENVLSKLVTPLRWGIGGLKQGLKQVRPLSFRPPDASRPAVDGLDSTPLVPTKLPRARVRKEEERSRNLLQIWSPAADQ